MTGGVMKSAESAGEPSMTLIESMPPGAPIFQMRQPVLPMPILDGGQILFQAIEWLKGSPLSERFQTISQQLGVALLVLLMGVALFNDLTRQLG